MRGKSQVELSPFLLLSRGSVTFAAVDIHGSTWQVASGVDDLRWQEKKGGY